MLTRRSTHRVTRALATLALLLSPLSVVADQSYFDRKDVTIGAFETVYFQNDDGRDRFFPEAVEMDTRSGSWRSEPPGEAEVIDYGRVDVSGVVVLNRVFGRPLLSYIEPRRRVGDLLRRGDTLVVRLAPGFESYAPEFARRKLALATFTLRGRNKVALRLPRMSAAGGGSVADGGSVIGGVYDADDALLLAPQRGF